MNNQPDNWSGAAAGLPGQPGQTPLPPGKLQTMVSLLRSWPSTSGADGQTWADLAQPTGSAVTPAQTLINFSQDALPYSSQDGYNPDDASWADMASDDPSSPGANSGGDLYAGIDMGNGAGANGQPRKRCLPNVGEFVNARRADATRIANTLPPGTTPQEVLAVSGNETGYGTGGMAPRGNFFGVHAPTTGRFLGQAGVYKAKQDGYLATFSPASGFMDSGRAFARIVSPHLSDPGATDPANFFSIIHQHGYGSTTPDYVAQMLKVYPLIGNCM